MFKPHSAPTGLNSQTLFQADLELTVALARRYKFDGVELAADLLERSDDDESRRILQESGVNVLGVSPTTSLLHWHGRFDPQLHSDLKRQLERAKMLGAEYFVLPFMRPTEPGLSAGPGLRRALDLAEDIGIDIGVESIGHVDSYRGVEELAQLVTDAESSRVGVLFDSFHFFRAGHEIDDLRHLESVRLVSVQISNANSLPREELLGYRDRMFPLDGTMPVTELVQAVLKTRPGLPVIVEVIGDEVGRHSPEDGARIARDQLEIMNNQIVNAGEAS